MGMWGARLVAGVNDNSRWNKCRSSKLLGASPALRERPTL